MESVHFVDGFNSMSVPVAKEIKLENTPIGIHEIQLENVCFSKNGINSVHRPTLRRRFKPKVNVFYWINKTRAVNKKPAPERKMFDF